MHRPETRCVLLVVVALALSTVSMAGCQKTERLRMVAGDARVSPWATSPDEETVVAPTHLVAGLPARNADGTVNAVIEIPAGTTAKFEVEKASGQLRWEYEDGRPRVVDFLGYPANYGMVPSTLIAEGAGGDGDPLDVLVLGTALERGQVVKVRVIGMLRLIDDGEEDGKLIAVPIEHRYGQGFTGLEGLHEMEELYLPAMQIIELWFTGYKGPNRVESRGWAYAPEAMDRVLAAEQSFSDSGRRVMATAGHQP